MSPNPEIHDWNTLTRILRLPVPPFLYQSSYSFLQVGTREHTLCLIRSHHARTNGSAYDCSRMGEDEEVGCIAERYGKDVGNDTPKWCKMGVEVGGLWESH